MIHFQAFMERLWKFNDLEKGIFFRHSAILSGPEYDDDLRLILQTYADYVAERAEILLKNSPYRIFGFHREFTESVGQEDSRIIYFTSVIEVNSQPYEIVVEKCMVVDKRLAKNKRDFNEKTKHLILSIANRTLNLGIDLGAKQLT